MSSKVRMAAVTDAIWIRDLLQYYAKHGRLLPRSTEEIVERLSSFFVSEQDSTLAGCVSLEVFRPSLAKYEAWL